MKAARLQVLTTPVFRDWLRKEARNAGVSVAELVRRRCGRTPTGGEQAVAKLASHLHKEVRKAQASLRSGLAEATAVLEDLRAERKRRRCDECFDPGHRRHQEALKLTDVVRRAGETLKDLAPEIRDHDRRIALGGTMGNRYHAVA